MKLFIDDERPTPDGFHLRVFTAAEAIGLLERGGITHVSLDHDLGPETAGTGYDVACWIEEHAQSGKLEPLTWAIHSANPVGRRRIEVAMKNADRYWSLNS